MNCEYPGGGRFRIHTYLHMIHCESAPTQIHNSHAPSSLIRSIVNPPPPGFTIHTHTHTHKVHCESSPPPMIHYSQFKIHTYPHKVHRGSFPPPRIHESQFMHTFIRFIVNHLPRIHNSQYMHTQMSIVNPPPPRIPQKVENSHLITLCSTLSSSIV